MYESVRQTQKQPSLLQQARPTFVFNFDPALKLQHITIDGDVEEKAVSFHFNFPPPNINLHQNIIRTTPLHQDLQRQNLLSSLPVSTKEPSLAPVKPISLVPSARTGGIVSASSLSSRNFPEKLEVRIEGIGRAIDFALQALSLLGRPLHGKPTPSEHLEFRDRVKSLLLTLKETLLLIEEMLICNKRDFNPIISDTLSKSWHGFEMKCTKTIQLLRDEISKLKEPLPDDHVELLDNVINKINEALRTENLERLEYQWKLELRYLTDALDKFKSQLPSQERTCFICYSWTNERNKRTAQRIADDLKRSGITVKIDIQYNKNNSINAFTNLIMAVDYVAVAGTPDLVEKWEKYVRECQSTENVSKDYHPSVVTSEIEKISLRLSNKPGNHGIINQLIDGERFTSFPSDLLSLPCCDFTDRNRYGEVLFDLLAKLLPKTEIEFYQTKVKQQKEKLQQEFQRLYNLPKPQIRQEYANSLKSKPPDEELDVKTRAELNPPISLSQRESVPTTYPSDARILQIDGESLGSRLGEAVEYLSSSQQVVDKANSLQLSAFSEAPKSSQNIDSLSDPQISMSINSHLDKHETACTALPDSKSVSKTPTKIVGPGTFEEKYCGTSTLSSSMSEPNTKAMSSISSSSSAILTAFTTSSQFRDDAQTLQIASPNSIHVEPDIVKEGASESLGSPSASEKERLLIPAFERLQAESIPEKERPQQKPCCGCILL